MPKLSLPDYRPNVGHIGHAEPAGFGMSFIYSAQLIQQILRDMCTRTTGAMNDSAQHFLRTPPFTRSRLRCALQASLARHQSADQGRGYES